MPITPPRMKESRLLRKLILWMRLLMVGKRSVGGEECGEGKIIKVEGDVPLLAVCVRGREREEGREGGEEGGESGPSKEIRINGS